MKKQFHHVALIGKYLQAPGPHAAVSEGTPQAVLRSVIGCLLAHGCQVSVEAATAERSGLGDMFPTLALDQIGRHCDLAVVVGGDGTMLSAGGPLMHPSVPGWVLVPIAPHTLSNRPIVLSGSSEIAVRVVAGRKASANFDTQSLSQLQPDDRVVVTRSRHEALFLHPVGWNYYDTLREKLHWNSGSN